MLPVYKAQSFSNIMVGGSTKPWLILVNVNEEPVPYVVKLYKKEHVDQTFAVAKDVYCSVLARLFKLGTPDSALIEFDEDFISQLTPELRNELISKDSRIKFGTKLVQGAYQYIETSHKDYFHKYNIETIYAFDNFIKNPDRRDGKSNILLKGTNSFLIDHELALSINQQTIDDFHNNNWIYYKQRHIFYNYLREKHVDTKRQYFANFSELLIKANFDILDNYNSQLVDYEHINDYKYYEIKNYLCTLQQYPEKFVKLLIANLS